MEVTGALPDPSHRDLRSRAAGRDDGDLPPGTSAAERPGHRLHRPEGYGGAGRAAASPAGSGLAARAPVLEVPDVPGSWRLGRLVGDQATRPWRDQLAATRDG